jgi:nicotinamidase-related amidase
MIEPETRLDDPALLIVDMQNDFVRQGAPLEVPDARDTLDVHRALITAFRECGRPVIYPTFPR